MKKTICPTEYICELSGRIMMEDNRPVIDPTTGKSVSLLFMKEWLKKQPISPFSRKPLKETDLILNLTLEKAIEDWSTQQIEINYFDENDLEINFLTTGNMGMINCRCKDSKTRDGIYVVLNFDNSGSTSKNAEIKGVESTGLTILDLECHSAITFICSLSPEDEVSLVIFNSVVEVIFKKLRMDEAGKLEAKSYINQLSSTGCTNMSGGIQKSMELLHEDEEFNGKK